MDKCRFWITINSSLLAKFKKELWKFTCNTTQARGHDPVGLSCVGSLRLFSLRAGHWWRDVYILLHFCLIHFPKNCFRHALLSIILMASEHDDHLGHCSYLSLVTWYKSNLNTTTLLAWHTLWHTDPDVGCYLWCSRTPSCLWERLNADIRYGYIKITPDWWCLKLLL